MRGRVAHRAGWVCLFSLSSAAGAAEAPQPAFVNVAEPGGVFEAPGGGRGALAFDYDVDGDLDLLIASSEVPPEPGGDVDKPLTMLRNDGDGNFVDATDEAGLSTNWRLVTFGITTADVDNDGWPDLFLGNGGKQSGEPPDILYINQGGSFWDGTTQAGIEAGPTQTFVGVWLDVDNDGYIDLLRVGFGATVTKFYKNVDGSTFVDRSEEYGIGNLSLLGQGSTTGDINNDGYVDVYIPTMGQQKNVLLINENGTRFSDQAASYGVDSLPAASYASSMVDLDNDGWLDLAVAGYGDIRQSDTPEMSRVFLNVPAPELGPGRRRMRDVSVASGFHHRLNDDGIPVGGGAMGLQTGDFDLDGRQDIYVANGGPLSEMAEVDLLFWNRGSTPTGLDLRNVTDSLVNPYQEDGVSTVHMSHGVVFFDYDGDGDIDIYANSGGPGFWNDEPAVAGQANALWRNDAAAGNHYVRILLEGIGAGGTNRSAIGARVHVSAPAGRPEAHQYQDVKGANGFGQQNSPWLTFGLNRFTDCDVEVIWTTGQVDRFLGVQADSTLRIHELTGLTVDPLPGRVEPRIP